MTPCISHCVFEDRNSFGVLMLQASKRNLFPLIVPKIYVNYFNQNSSVTVKVSLSKPGTVYCNAIKETVPLTSVFQVINGGRSSLLTSTTLNNTIFRFSNIISGLNYYFYCYTEDFSGHTMTVSDVQSTAVFVKTDRCCRALTLNFEPSIYISTVYSPIMSFTLASLPVSYIKVAVVIKPCKSGFQPDFMPIIYPSSFEFDYTSLFSYGNFTVKSRNINATGCFLLNASVVAKGITDVSYSSDQRTIQIQAHNARPSTPRLLSFIMSNDGRQLIATFSLSTNLATFQLNTYFTCESILRFTKSTVTNCYWSTPTTLIANIFEYNVVNVGDSVTCKGVVQAACPANSAFDCRKLYNSAGVTRIIQAPSQPLQPRIVLSASLKSSFCDPLTIDPTMSTGNAYRAWKNVSWTVRCNNPVDANVSGIQDYLNNHYRSTVSTIYIPNIYLWRKYPLYISCNLLLIELQLKNTFGQVGIGAISIAITNDINVPSATLSSSSSVMRWQPLAIFGTGAFSTCGSASNNLQYTWKVYLDKQYVPIVSSSSDQSILLIQPYTLQPNSVYSVQLIVSFDSAQAILSSAITQVRILSSPLVVVFYGGSLRKISNAV
jgi:hypothetical protein